MLAEFWKKKVPLKKHIAGVDLFEMTFFTLYPTTVTFQAFRRLTIMCEQLAHVPI